MPSTYDPFCQQLVEEAALDLAARPLLAQCDGACLSRPTTWKVFLPMSIPTTAIRE